MSQTDGKRERSELLAGALYDELLAPLARARREAGAAPYFPSWRDQGASSYFEPVAHGRMSPGDFRVPGAGSTRALITELAALWQGQGELGLASAAPRLSAIADALEAEAAADDGSVDIFCYTLF